MVKYNRNSNFLMKTDRVLVIVLSLLVLWLGYLQLSRKKPISEPPREMWHTNTVAVDQWHTNTVAVNQWHTNTMNLWRTNTLTLNQWHTNTVELWHTNTVVQNFTNEIVKEVPAQLSPAARDAATIGYRYLNAPLAANASDALYKAGPIAVEVNMAACDRSLAAENTALVKKNAEAALRSRNIAIGESSPHRLSITIAPVWNTDVPKVAIMAFRLDLKEKTVLQRQNDLVRFNSILWSSAGSSLVRKVSVEEDLTAGVQEQIDKFCKDYLKAKETEKGLESRIPTMPNGFLPEQ